ncbi:MAG: 16S rRNA (cytosine(1402)-N(4))-methyltransferase RsmH [Patescibacteria group bacterium]
MNTNNYHVPVMLKEVLEYLNPRPGQFFIDGTLGGGGYTIAIAKRVGENGIVLGIDLDDKAIKNAKLQITNYKLQNTILAHDNFKNLSKIVNKYFKKDQAINGIVFDLGLSSAQLEDRTRGFSFQLDAPLDMAFGHQQRTANNEQQTDYIINKYQQRELERIIREYGEERYAKRIAQKIVESRKNKLIKTTGQLVEIIKKAVPKKYLYSKIHPATRTFQALRIATNDELRNLEEALPQAIKLLAKRGRIVVISYHSLEDRIVKQFFKKEKMDCLCPKDMPICQCNHKAQVKIITKKIIIPNENEIKNNPRSRSAKMRIAEKV